MTLITHLLFVKQVQFWFVEIMSAILDMRFSRMMSVHRFAEDENMPWSSMHTTHSKHTVSIWNAELELELCRTTHRIHHMQIWLHVIHSLSFPLLPTLEITRVFRYGAWKAAVDLVPSKPYPKSGYYVAAIRGATPVVPWLGPWPRPLWPCLLYLPCVLLWIMICISKNQSLRFRPNAFSGCTAATS